MTVYYKSSFYRAALNAEGSRQYKADRLSVSLSNVWIVTNLSRFLHYTKEHLA